MPSYGYHASHEQFAPSDLLTWVQQAEAAGFRGGMSSDHLFPWLPGHTHGCGFSFAWLGAALQATSLPFGMVCAPGQRYHPTTIAQAAATLAELFPGRFWIALGSGEYANEHVTGQPWPEKTVREARLRECVDVIRALWNGETVDHDGLVTVRQARVYPDPIEPPAIVGPAISVETARWMGGWADALVTVNSPVGYLRQVIDAFREGGGEGKPVRLQYHLSWAPTEDEALHQAFAEWKHALAGYDAAWDFALPEQFAERVQDKKPEDIREAVAVGADPGWHADRIADYAGLGFDQIMLHQVGRNQAEFLDTFGAKVLPLLP